MTARQLIEALAKPFVLGADGKPLLMYHGTRSEFERFGKVNGGNQWGPGYYFTVSEAQGHDYAHGRNVNRITVDAGQGTPRVITAHLRAVRPYVMDTKLVLDARTVGKIGRALDPANPREFAQSYDRSYPPTATNVWSNLALDYGTSKAVSLLRAAGFDAITDRHYWAVFDPAQIEIVQTAAAV